MVYTFTVLKYADSEACRNERFKRLLILGVLYIYLIRSVTGANKYTPRVTAHPRVAAHSLSAIGNRCIEKRLSGDSL